MLLSIFNTVEFYVVTAFIAAAIVGLAALPARRGAARQILVGGDLLFDAPSAEPEITFTVEDNGDIRVIRHGLEGVLDCGAYSLAVTIIGFDVTIEERLTAGRGEGVEAGGACAKIAGLGAERYHFQYRSEATGRSAAFSLNLRPGNSITRPLT